MNFKKMTIALALVLTMFAVSAKAHECPPGTIQIVDLIECLAATGENCHYYTHYCFQCGIDYNGLLTITNLSFTITANSSCFLDGTCVASVWAKLLSNLQDPVWWQSYSNQLCLDGGGGAPPCAPPPAHGKIVFTYVPICWDATLDWDLNGEYQYTFHPCPEYQYCCIKWEVCWNYSLAKYVWTEIERYQVGGGTPCPLLFLVDVPLPTMVGVPTPCFKFDTTGCP